MKFSSRRLETIKNLLTVIKSEFKPGNQRVTPVDLSRWCRISKLKQQVVSAFFNTGILDFILADMSM